MFNGYNEVSNFYNQGLFENCNNSGLLSGEMSKHSSAPPWDYTPQPYNNLPCYAGQQPLSHRPLIHNQVVSHLEKKENSLNGTNSTHKYSSNNAHQPVVKPTALINCQANCNACCSHSSRVPHHWNAPSESVRYLDHTSLPKELPRYPHGVSNLSTDDARFMGDFSSTFDKLPFFPRDAVENLNHASVAGVANKKEFVPSVLHDNQHQNTTIGSDVESVKKEKCTKCRGVCRSNCKQSKQQSAVKLSNQDQLHVSRENVVRYSGHPSLSSTTWPMTSQAQSGMWFQNTQPPFWMAHNDVQMPASDSFGYWPNNEDLSTNISHHGRPSMQNTSRYPGHVGSQESAAVPEAEQNKFKSMMSYQDSYKHKCAELKANGVTHGEILRKELQEPAQNKVMKQRLQAGRSLDMSREYAGRNCDLAPGSHIPDASKPSVYESSVESPYTGGDEIGKLYGSVNNANNIRTGATNFNSYPFVNVNNSYNVGLPQHLSQFSSHISYNTAKLEGGNNYVNNLQYSNAASVGSFISSQIENNHSNSYAPAVAKVNATTHHTMSNSCIQYSPSKKNPGDFSISQQSTTHPVSDVIKYNFSSNPGNEPAYSMLQSCNKMSENVACGKTMQMISGPGSCAEKVGSKTNPYYFSNLPHSVNNTYAGSAGRNMQMRPPFRFDSVDVGKESSSCNVYCDGARDNRTTSNYQYENSPQLQNSSNNVSPSAQVSDSSPIQVDSPFVTHSPVCVSRPIKKRRPRSKGATRNEQSHKGPILDVRQYLATWDEESDDVTTMNRLPDVLSNGSADGLIVLNGTGGRTVDPGLGLVPMYNELADDGSESSSVHSENAQSCQHASIENLTETVDLPKSDVPNLETMMSKDGNNGGVLEEGNINEKVVSGISERLVSPSHPRINSQSVDRTASVSPCDRQQHTVNLQTQSEKYSGLESHYLPSESNNLLADSCKIEYMNETKSPVAVSATQSFDTATALLSDDHETLSSCGLVSDMHITESVSLPEESASTMNNAVPVGASHVEVVKSCEEESFKCPSTGGDSFGRKSENENSSSVNQLGLNSTSVKNESSSPQVIDPGTFQYDADKTESTLKKDAGKNFQCADQQVALYSGRDERTLSADCNGSSTASEKFLEINTGSVLASTTSDILKEHEKYREVFISTDIQFPDLSYANSDNSVDGEMQTNKEVFSEDLTSSPLSVHDSYSEKHTDPSFIRSFVNEIASNIPNFDSHTTDHQESLCGSSQVLSDKKTDEKNPDAPVSPKCNVLLPADTDISSQYSKSEDYGNEVAEKKKLLDHISCETIAKLQNCNTVITNVNCQSNYSNSASDSIVEVKQISEESSQTKKSVRLKSLRSQSHAGNKTVNSHYLRQKIKLRTREAKNCSPKKSALKTGNVKHLIKEGKKFKQRLKVLRKRKLFSSADDKNVSPDLVISKKLLNDGEIQKVKNISTNQQTCGDDDHKLEHKTGNTLEEDDKLNSLDLKLEVSSKHNEPEVAMNLVLESAKCENLSDTSSTCPQKYVPKPVTLDCMLSQDICETSRFENEPESLMSQTSVAFVVDEKYGSCKGGHKTDEAVDLSISKPDTNTAVDVNINCLRVESNSKSALFCGKIGQDTNIQMKSAILNYTKSNFTSNKVACHQAVNFELGVQTGDTFAEWQSHEILNHKVISYQKSKTVEGGFATDSVLNCTSESYVAAEVGRSNTPVQEEALDLCKRDCKEQNQYDEKISRVYNVCITSGTGSQGQQDQCNKLDVCSNEMEENLNGETAGLSQMSPQPNVKDKCSVIVLHGQKVPDVVDVSENKVLSETVGACNTADCESSVEVFSEVKCSHSWTENSSVDKVDKNQLFKRPNSSEQSELSLNNPKGTQNCTPDNCRESSFENAFFTSASGHLSAESGVNNMLPELSGGDLDRSTTQKKQKGCADYNSKIGTIYNNEGVKSSELLDDSSEHGTGVSRSLVYIKNDQVNVCQVDSYKTESTCTSVSEDGKNVIATNDTIHCVSSGAENENISDGKHFDRGFEANIPYVVEDYKQADLSDLNVCKRESCTSVGIQSRNDELQLSNRQESELEQASWNKNRCNTQRHSSESVQDQIAVLCTSLDQTHSDLESSCQEDDNELGKSVSVETTLNDVCSEQTSRSFDLNVVEIQRPVDIYTQDCGRQQYNDCKEASIMIDNYEYKQLKAQCNSFHGMKEDLLNQNDSEPCNQEKSGNLQQPTSDDGHATKLLSSQNSEILVPEKADSRPIDFRFGEIDKKSEVKGSEYNKNSQKPLLDSVNMVKTEVKGSEYNKNSQKPLLDSVNMVKTETSISEKLQNENNDSQDLFKSLSKSTNVGNPAKHISEKLSAENNESQDFLKSSESINMVKPASSFSEKLTNENDESYVLLKSEPESINMDKREQSISKKYVERSNELQDSQKPNIESVSDDKQEDSTTKRQPDKSDELQDSKKSGSESVIISNPEDTSSEKIVDKYYEFQGSQKSGPKNVIMNKPERFSSEKLADEKEWQHLSNSAPGSNNISKPEVSTSKKFAYKVDLLQDSQKSDSESVNMSEPEEFPSDKFPVKNDESQCSEKSESASIIIDNQKVSTSEKFLDKNNELQDLLKSRSEGINMGKPEAFVSETFVDGNNVLESLKSGSQGCSVSKSEISTLEEFPDKNRGVHVSRNIHEVSCDFIGKDLTHSKHLGNSSLANKVCISVDVGDQDSIVDLRFQEQCHKNGLITSLNTQNSKSAGLVCCNSLTTKAKFEFENNQKVLALQLAIKEESEKLLTLNVTDTELPEQADHLYRSDMCTNVDLLQDETKIQKQGGCQENETVSMIVNDRKELEVTEMDGGKMQKPDFNFKKVVLDFDCDDNQPMSTCDSFCITQASSPANVQDTVCDGQPSSDNTFQTENSTENILDSSLTEHDQSSLPKQQRVKDQSSFGLVEKSLHDETSSKTNVEVRCIQKVGGNKFGNGSYSSCGGSYFSSMTKLGDATFIGTVASDHGLVHSESSVLQMVENTDSSSSYLSGSISALNKNGNELNTLLNHGRLEKSLPTLTQSSTEKYFSENKETKAKEFPDETVQKPQLVLRDVTASAKKNGDVTRVLLGSRSVMESELLLGPHSSVVINVNTESMSDKDVAVQVDKISKGIVPATGYGSTCVPDLLHSSYKNNGEFNNQGCSKVVHSSESTSKLVHNAECGTGLSEDIASRKLVSVDGLEDIEVGLPSDEVLPDALAGTSKNNDLINNFAESKNMNGQEITCDTVAASKIVENQITDISENGVSANTFHKMCHPEIMQCNASEPDNKTDAGHPRTIQVKENFNTSKTTELLENEIEEIISLEGPVALPQTGSIQQDTVCSSGEQELEENIVVTSDNLTKLGNGSNCEMEENSVAVKLVSSIDECKDGYENCIKEATDVPSTAVSAKCNMASNLKEQNFDSFSEHARTKTTENDMLRELQNAACIENSAINDEQIATDSTHSRNTSEMSKESKQKSFDQEPVDKVDVICLAEENNDKSTCMSILSSTFEKNVEECDHSVEASLVSNGELIEGQLIIIQNNYDNGVTNSIKISAESMTVKSVCLEDLEHDDNEGSNTWPVIVESDEATEIIIAVAEGTTDEVSESEMPHLEIEAECLKSPEMPCLEVMTKPYENESSDQDLEMPVLDVNSSDTTEVVTDATEMPKLESAVVSSGAEVITSVHPAISEFSYSHVTPTEHAEAIDLQWVQPFENDCVCKRSGSTSDEKDVCLSQENNPLLSLRDNILSSAEVGNIFPVTTSDNVEPSFHEAAHIIPGDSVSNWPYLEEEVLSELVAPDPETTVPLLDAASDTLVSSHTSKTCSPNLRLDNSRNLGSAGQKFHAKGWSKNRIFHCYNYETPKTLFRKKGYLNWNRIFARSKVNRSKYFKAKKNNRSKISQSWPYFSKRTVKWLKEKPEINYSKTVGLGVLGKEGDSHEKIEMRLAQKCEQVDGTKTWCVVGSSEVNNDNGWPVIEENNNVMSSSGLSNSEEKVPVVLVKRLVLKKSNNNSNHEGMQEYTVKSANTETISPTTVTEHNSVEANSIDDDSSVCGSKTIESSFDNLLTSKECSVDIACSKTVSCQADLTTVSCRVCDSNVSTVPSPGYCKKHSPKHIGDCSEHISVDEHQVSNSAHHVPRVIIKRTGPGSAKYQSFLRSSPGGSQWQPVVQLLRSKVLDNLVRNVLEVGSFKKVISLSNLRLVLRKRTNAAPESLVESDGQQPHVISEPSQSSCEDLGEEGEFNMVHEEEEEESVKSESSCKYVVVENNTKDTRLTFQRQRCDSQIEETPQQTDEQCINETMLLPAEMTSSKAKEDLSPTEMSDDHLSNRNRDRKCKAVFTYMESSSSEDSQENNELLCPVVRINRKRLSENEDKSQTFSEVCNKKPFLCAEVEASTTAVDMLVNSGKRKHSFSENTECTRKKPNVSRHNSSNSVDDLCSFDSSIGGIEDSVRLGFREGGWRRPRSLRCKNVVAVPQEESAPDACRVCSYVFVDEADKADHVKQHPYHCQRCHLAFQSKMDFRNHLSSMHPRTKEQHHCLLCERTFPTAARHKVHLTGRQHRYLETTQRRTIHTLFKLFTNDFCPALPPPTREELAGLSWFPSEAGTIHFYHQATPLQLAVQDLMWRRRQLSGSSSESVPDGPEGR